MPTGWVVLFPSPRRSRFALTSISPLPTLPSDNPHTDKGLGENCVTITGSFVTSRLRRQATFEYQESSGRNGPGRALPSSRLSRCLGRMVVVRILKTCRRFFVPTYTVNGEKRVSQIWCYKIIFNEQVIRDPRRATARRLRRTQRKPAAASWSKPIAAVIS